MRIAVSLAVRRVVLSVALLLAVAGCGTFVSETQLNPAPQALPPRGPQAVEIYSSSAPARAHVDVALLEVSQNDGQGTGAMIQLLRERAGEMGCDAVVLGGTRERGDSGDLPSMASITLNATCIVYRRPGDPVADRLPTVRGSRRTCHDLADFRRNRNCIVPRGAH